MASANRPPIFAGLRAGPLRQLVELQARTENVDAAGAMLEPSWTTVARMRADVQPIVGRKGGENVIAEQLMTAIYYYVSVHFRTDVTTRHRLLQIGPPNVPLNIKFVSDPDSRRRRLVIVCESGLVEG